MHRIDGAGNVGGMFVSEDPATNRPPTEITPEIMNAFQEEIVQVIQWAGLVLNKLDNTQLKQALIAQFMLKTDLADLTSDVADVVDAKIETHKTDPNAHAQYLAAWVSGRQYVQGDVRFSPLDLGLYRCSTSTSGAVDPSLDPQHWTLSSALTSIVNAAVSRAINEALPIAVANALPSVVADAVSIAVNNAVATAVANAVPQAVTAAMNGAITELLTPSAAFVTAVVSAPVRAILFPPVNEGAGN